MELLLIIGLTALAVLMALGVLAYLHHRRTGTILAVTLPARSLVHTQRRPGGGSLPITRHR